jgi:hypothetical protein
MPGLLDTLDPLVGPWADLFNHTSWLQTLVACLHVGGTLLGGGLAIAADRTTLRATRDHTDVPPHILPELADVHRPVLVALIVTTVSGFLLFAADLDALWVSWVMWTKLGLFVLLLVNGWLIVRTEAALAHSYGDLAAWTRLRRFSLVSQALWFGVALTGTALLNVS